jgi:peptidoglycan/xylan/chitin deacetylase (PgdA/CDA1 family)
LRTLRPIARRSSLILAYHGLSEGVPVGDPSNLFVRVERFRAQVEMLGDAGFAFVTVEEFARRAAGGPPPPGLVALSFDDGMADNHQLLLPLLREYDIAATIYVATGFVGEPNPWLAPSSGARMMTAGELRDCLAAGVELGAHSHTHPDMLELDQGACLAEMRRSSDELVRLTGTRPADLRLSVLPLRAAGRGRSRGRGFRGCGHLLGTGRLGSPHAQAHDDHRARWPAHLCREGREPL